MDFSSKPIIFTWILFLILCICIYVLLNQINTEVTAVTKKLATLENTTQIHQLHISFVKAAAPEMLEHVKALKKKFHLHFLQQKKLICIYEDVSSDKSASYFSLK